MLLELQGHLRVLALVRPSSLGLQLFPNTYLGSLTMIPYYIYRAVNMVKTRCLFGMEQPQIWPDLDDRLNASESEH